MSIIDKLGGYSRAKNYLENELISGYKKIQLKSELLEYRREHGIFEVGDNIIDTDLLEDRVVVVLGIEYGNLYKISENTFWEFGGFRHATDLEIAAGHRLP